MYSDAWFSTFAARVPESVTEAEIAAVARLAPPHEYPRLLDVGCGIGRCYHEIRYPDGSVDHMQFNVYRPEEAEGLLREAGLRIDSYLAWWNADLTPGAEFARYQIVCTRADPR